jgi:hypothetical protein
MCTRRDLLKRSAAALLLPLAACGKASGPEEVAWGRDACEHCRMIISEKGFAAELRSGERNRIHKFDDIGCAVHWAKANAQPLDTVAEFWVMSHADGKRWLEARQAWYRVDVRSPMNYNFAAEPQRGEAAVSYADMIARLAAGSSHSDCPPPNTSVAAADLSRG